jgi:TPP-dependent pyruvate/acetoin dehydrogenase alpha subunit
MVDGWVTVAFEVSAVITGPGELEPMRILAPDGTVPDSYQPPVSAAELLAAYRLMALSRRLDELAFSLQRQQGRLGTFSRVHCQGASVVGRRLRSTPHAYWVVPQYRELPAMLRHVDGLGHPVALRVAHEVEEEALEGVARDGGEGSTACFYQVTPKVLGRTRVSSRPHKAALRLVRSSG